MYLRTTSVSIDDALRRYESERMGRVHAVVEGSRQKGDAATDAESDANKRYYEELRKGSRDFVESVEQLTSTGPLR
jgi:FAD-dependent urate hydroxylase